MSRYLIVYASKQGQTNKIAEFIHSELVKAGHLVDLYDCEQVSEQVSPRDYDATIVGGPVHIHGYPCKLQRWTKTHAAELSQKPSSFFSVCLGILQDDPKVQKEERKIVEEFFIRTGWFPENWTIFAGALKYSKYNWFLKKAMRKMASMAGVDTDPKKDYEYTDWNAVRKFVGDNHVR